MERSCVLTVHDDFNTTAKSSLVEVKENIHIVMGNEAADLDSIVCSITYAYFLAQRSLTESNVRVIPVIDIPRKDFQLRAEISYLFKSIKLKENLLTFADEIDLQALYDANKLSLTIVDHNRLSNKHEQLADCITDIVDHHLDEDQFPECDIILEPVGSCATLIAEQLMDGDCSLIDNEVGLLLLSAIIVDTANLDVNFARTTEKDIEIANKLETYVDFDELPFSRLELYDKMKEAKFNVSHLSTYDLLRKDYKSIAALDQSVGISSVTIPMEEFIERNQFVNDVSAFGDEKNLAGFVIMSFYFESDIAKRQLLVYEKACNDNGTKIGLFLSRAPTLKIEAVDCPHPCMQIFKQLNVKDSRKVIMPLVKEFLNTGLKSLENETKTENMNSEICTSDAALIADITPHAEPINVSTANSNSDAFSVASNADSTDKIAPDPHDSIEEVDNEDIIVNNNDDESQNSGSYTVNQVNNECVDLASPELETTTEESVKLLKVSKLNLESESSPTSATIIDENQAEGTLEISDNSDSEVTASYDVNEPLENLNYQQENTLNKKILSYRSLGETDTKNVASHELKVVDTSENSQSTPLSPIDEESPSYNVTTTVSFPETSNDVCESSSHNADNSIANIYKPKAIDVSAPEDIPQTDAIYLPELSPIPEESPRREGMFNLDKTNQGQNIADRTTVSSLAEDESNVQFCTAIGDSVADNETSYINDEQSNSKSYDQNSFTGNQSMLQSTVVMADSSIMDKDEGLQTTNLSVSNYETCIQDSKDQSTAFMNNIVEKTLDTPQEEPENPSVNHDVNATIIAASNSEIAVESCLNDSLLDATLVANQDGIEVESNHEESVTENVDNEINSTIIIAASSPTNIPQSSTNDSTIDATSVSNQSEPECDHTSQSIVEDVNTIELDNSSNIEIAGKVEHESDSLKQREILTDSQDNRIKDDAPLDKQCNLDHDTEKVDNMTTTAEPVACRITACAITDALSDSRLIQINSGNSNTATENDKYAYKPVDNKISTLDSKDTNLSSGEVEVTGSENIESELTDTKEQDNTEAVAGNSQNNQSPVARPSSFNREGKRKSVLKVPATLSTSLTSPAATADDSTASIPPSTESIPENTKQESTSGATEDDTLPKSKSQPRKLKVPRSISNIDPDAIEEYTAEEELSDTRTWRLVNIGGESKELDLRIVEAYRKVVSHGGYTHDGSALIVFSGCYMPKKSEPNYSYILDHLFLYVMSTVETLVVQQYRIIFFNGGMSKDSFPSFKWLKKCYKTIDRSPKFGRKIKFVSSLEELKKLVSLDQVSVPDVEINLG
ncbi:uncharacterized protein TRIADDRAFT_60259 [Trichoplax adhaerens]|uniref:inorganic diphosphatase n=1 Tax=Trichoplax adhaerens TaxID=10228 RepID=B3S7R0_TRIAD|nr:hypothetical protein TRIADDRAFT_60259 [Trichoplax adhaerens]EDV21335.1 hypothetical protein TRIADDRAFT_60259 [Trichoplax adhaerens]|eukprot:XP_002116302.1 hypothetical protein TRIADDRAFT_60259 [Trichoplax adhaerens]